MLKLCLHTSSGLCAVSCLQCWGSTSCKISCACSVAVALVHRQQVPLTCKTDVLKMLAAMPFLCCDCAVVGFASSGGLVSEICMVVEPGEAGANLQQHWQLSIVVPQKEAQGQRGLVSTDASSRIALCATGFQALSHIDSPHKSLFVTIPGKTLRNSVYNRSMSGNQLYLKQACARHGLQRLPSCSELFISLVRLTTSSESSCIRSCKLLQERTRTNSQLEFVVRASVERGGIARAAV